MTELIETDGYNNSKISKSTEYQILHKGQPFGTIVHHYKVNTANNPRISCHMAQVSSKYLYLSVVECLYGVHFPTSNDWVYIVIGKLILPMGSL